MTTRIQCNTLIESHKYESDTKVIQIWDYIIEDDLKKLIGIAYTNKMHLLFSSLSLKNSTIKRAWLGVVIGQVTFWEVFQKACEWGQNMLKSFVLVCGDSHWS